MLMIKMTTTLQNILTIAFTSLNKIGTGNEIKEVYQCVCALLCWGFEEFGHCGSLFDVEIQMAIIKDNQFYGIQKNSGQT